MKEVIAEIKGKDLVYSHCSLNHSCMSMEGPKIYQCIYCKGLEAKGNSFKIDCSFTNSIRFILEDE